MAKGNRLAGAGRGSIMFDRKMAENVSILWPEDMECACRRMEREAHLALERGPRRLPVLRRDRSIIPTQEMARSGRIWTESVGTREGWFLERAGWRSLRIRHCCMSAHPTLASLS